MSTAVAERPAPNQSLVAKFAGRYNIDPNKLLATLKATAFRQRNNRDITDEQMAALLIVADQYKLNPFTKEIFAYEDKGAIVPVVSVDGWARIINEHPAFNGLEFRYSEEMETPAAGKACPVWCEILIYRKDRDRPTIVREYLDETYQGPRGENKVNGPWQSHTKRMLRHKVLIQGARIAFGFAGIYDEDEADRIVERDMGAAETVAQPASRVAMPQARPKQVASQPADVVEQPAQRTRQPVAQRQQAKEAAQDVAPTGAEPADGADLATDGEKQYVRTKLTGAEIPLQEALDTLGLSTPDTLDGLTRDGFVALQDFIQENC
ncbi:phage recombination protein Bet [Cupriavidus sp.]|uniref:phage recombination protein Bet n=1 Tax=Cupriavidus sp. TaxID=1873897 RepID=UPI0025C27666|nr:phage recombination protein Bet [Cupriavidus sp.]MCA3187578.1 phage recombination protein Bet [Cupriavidus sp.]MCA3190950.1 phage recombination protein Bet [Cupriavidus sp.]MCA3199294.1 phage recombination protein Bet [Cupriavidus sp.]MCA3204561.1 phage recombination protein Bet [Cupriavidus sp.]MCA3207740.1 phage recombination protein Bet [Cupriavidus sp.]